MPFMEDEFEFRARMNCPSIPMPKGGCLFSNGGRIWQDQLGDLQHSDPPEAPLKNLKARRRYHEERLDVATRAFEKLKAVALDLRRDIALSSNFRWPEQYFGPPPADDNGEPLKNEYGELDPIAGLNHLKELVAIEKEAIAEIDAKIAELPEVKAKREREEARARLEQKLRDKAREVKERIEAIVLD